MIFVSTFNDRAASGIYFYEKMWCGELCLTLIEMYREFPVLWDLSNKDY